jgi:hypothetical protein
VTDQFLFIPLLASQADILVDQNSSALQVLDQWDVSQVASVAVILNLPSIVGKAGSIMLVEKTLAELISVGTELSQSHPQGTFSKLIAGRFKRDLFESGLALMPRLGLRFLDKESLEAKEFLKGGHWDFNFSATHTQLIDPLKHSFETQTGKVISAICILGLEVIHSDPGFEVRSNAASGWISLFSAASPESNIGWVL